MRFVLWEALIIDVCFKNKTDNLYPRASLDVFDWPASHDGHVIRMQKLYFAIPNMKESSHGARDIWGNV